MLASDREAHQSGQGFPVWRLGEGRQRRQRLVGLGLREPRSVLKAPGGLNCTQDILEPVAATVADHFPHQLTAAVTGSQRVDQRQRGFALGQIVAEILAAGFRVRR